MKRCSSGSLTTLQSMKNGSSGSLTTLQSMKNGSSCSLTTLQSINLQGDFQKYIANMKEDIIKISNVYYYFNEKYNKKINNIVCRYEERTNKLFIDLRRREGEYRKLNNRLDDVVNDLQGYKGLKELFNRCEIICNYDDMQDLNNTYRYIRSILFIYTFCVVLITIRFIILQPL